MTANRRGASSFGGQGGGLPVNAPLSNRGYDSLSTYGANDNVRYNINSSGGDSVFSLIMVGVQAAIAVAQLNIARNYLEVNKQEFANNTQIYGGGYPHSNPNYFGPIRTHKDQAFDPAQSPWYVQDYYPITGASLARVKVYDEKWFQTRRRLHRYAIGHQRHVDYQFYMMRRKGAYAAWVAGRRMEDARKDWKDDQTQTHKVQALNFGITAGNIARQGLASSVGTLEHAYDELGSRIGGFSNGLSEYQGYKSQRKNASRMLEGDVS